MTFEPSERMTVGSAGSLTTDRGRDDGWPSRGVPDLREYTRILRRRWWVALLVLLACLGGAVFITFRQPKYYEGRARLFIGRQAATREELVLPLVQTSLALVNSYAEAITTRPIAEQVVSELKIPGGPDELLRRVRAEPVIDTQIIDLTYRDRVPDRARDVTNAFANVFVSSIGEIDPAGGTTASVKVLEAATRPRSPVSPKPVQNVALAAVLGSVLAFGVVLLVERFDTSVKGRDDAEASSGRPVLAIVPHFQMRGQNLVQAGVHLEAYRALRRSVQHLGLDRRAKVLGVTSPEGKDGKTTTAFNLATAFAEAGVQSVYVEADLRRPAIGSILDFGDDAGLASYLDGRGSVNGLVHRTWVPNLYVVPGGEVPENPSELLGKPLMKHLIEGLSQQAAIVLIDTPPVLAVSDALGLVPYVDGFIVVVRSAKTRLEHITETMRVLGGAGAPVLGLVVNDVGRASGYGYGYGYGY